MCFNPDTPIDQSWCIDLSAQRTAVLRWSYQSGLYMAYVLIDLPEDVQNIRNHIRLILYGTVISA